MTEMNEDRRDMEQRIEAEIRDAISAYRRIPAGWISIEQLDSVVTGNVVLGVAEYFSHGETDRMLYAAHPLRSDAVVILSRIGPYDASVWKESIEKLLKD